MRNAFMQTLTELAAHDPKIFLITGDLGFGVLEEFAKKFPKQFLNVGVAEQNMTGVATGLALEGYKVFTYSIGNFPTLRCLEQIRNDACYHGANVNIVAIGGGFSYGSLGFSHHATEDLAILRALPEMTVVSPGDLWETQGATAALANKKGPGYLRLDKSNAAPTHQTGETFTLGKARIVREGSDLTLMATGGILGVALQAAESLAKNSIQCRVVSFHTLKPVDEETIVNCALETGGLITIEEHSIHGGLAGVVSETLLARGVYPKAFDRLGLKACFSTVVGSQDYLRQVYGMDEKAIVTCAENLLAKKNPSSK